MLTTQKNQVQHTYPLSSSQQLALAEAITTLHSTTFVVPRPFVNVVFQHLQPGTSSGTTTYFLAGKPTAHNAAGPNRILGMVRQGPSRTKADFDRLAQRIEDSWYEVVNGPASDKNGGGRVSVNGEAADRAKEKEKADRNAKKLHFVAMYPMLAARENGTTIPGVSSFPPLFVFLLIMHAISLHSLRVCSAW